MFDNRELASQTALEIQEKQETEFDGVDPSTEFTRDLEQYNNNQLFRKINYRWRPEDKNALTQLRAAGDAMLMDLYGNLLDYLDEFYGELRVPEVNQYGVVLQDTSGRTIWKTQNGKPIEDWSNLTGQDIEVAIHKITKLQIESSQRVSELFLEATFAKYTYDDLHYEAYEGSVEGTIEDRRARANRKTREEKYHAFFRYYLYLRGNDLLKEIKNLVRVLERTRNWRLQEEYNGTRS